VIVGMAAVFSGAARVPLATMLMVTEMTGGYHLLAAAGLAVMLSYYVQVILSKGLKYQSLYEAQVPGRGPYSGDCIPGNKATDDGSFCSRVMFLALQVMAATSL
jgi:hypothetical protein